MRIERHPILRFDRGKRVKFTFNGKEFYGYENESIASALVAEGVTTLTRSKKYNRARGFFCGIGKCSSCLMEVNSIPNVRACIKPVRDGLTVRTHKYGKLPKAEKINYEYEILGTEISVVGAGPAGLAASTIAANIGAKTLIIDENPRLGGQLIKQTHKFFGSKSTFAGTRGIDIAQELQRILKTTTTLLGASVIGYYASQTADKPHTLLVAQENKLIRVHASKLIVTTGARENLLVFPGNDLPGVVGAGGLQTLINVYGVKPGKRALMVGAGNVGLIVAYQMLQAGIEVEMVIEAMPKIGGYFVHAAKLRRLGVPILVSHTIEGAYGKEKVEGARLVKLKSGKPIPESRFNVPVDLICLAVGLTPSSELLFQAGCEPVYIPELGGWVAKHDKNLETSIPGIYVAGDVSGIEEASTAIFEGKLAAIHALKKLGYEINKRERKEAIEQLKQLRKGRFGEKARVGKEKMYRMR